MQQATEAQSLEPAVVRKGEGEARWWFGALAEIKAAAADTGGQLTIIEITEPPNSEAPLHVHYRDDEAFWILEGSATFEIGDTTVEAGAGDYLFGPRGIPHRYSVGEHGCRMLFIMVPGGLEDVLRKTSEPALARTLPPPSEEEPDIEGIKAIVAEHGYALLV